MRQSLLEKARENFKIAVEEKTAKIKELVKLQIGKFFMPVFGVNERRQFKENFKERYSPRTTTASN